MYEYSNNLELEMHTENVPLAAFYDHMEIQMPALKRTIKKRRKKKE